MSLDQLETFVAVVEEGGVLRAARRLHLTQPPLSRRIRNLEEELGVELFEREARGMRLTPAGEELLPKARRILSAVAEVLAIRGGSDPDRPATAAGRTARAAPPRDASDPDERDP